VACLALGAKDDYADSTKVLLSVEFVLEPKAPVAFLCSCVLGRDMLRVPLHCSPPESHRRWLTGPAANWTIVLPSFQKAGPVPRPQFILLIEPDDDSRVMYADYQHTFAVTVLTADVTDNGLARATDADVIVTGIGVPGSRPPKCEEVYRLVMVL
jgi:hypothetical protein